jgi:hypothetical protein
MERVGDRQEKNGGILFDRPKPTASCSANGEEKKRYFSYMPYDVPCYCPRK